MSFAAACTLAALAACSPPSVPSGNATSAQSTPSASAAPQGSPCDRGLVTKADAAALLGEPATTMKPLEGLPTACRFETASFSGMTVRVASSGGQASVSAAASPQMPVPYAAVHGVGDRAEWQAETHALIAAKGDELCTITVDGPPGATAGATSDKVGELCNRIFAAG
jgi:hypothetical protein